MEELFRHFRRSTDAVERRYVDDVFVVRDVTLTQYPFDVVDDRVERRLGGIHLVMILVVVEVEVNVFHCLCELIRCRIRHTCFTSWRCSDVEPEETISSKASCYAVSWR